MVRMVRLVGRLRYDDLERRRKDFKAQGRGQAQHFAIQAYFQMGLGRIDLKLMGFENLELPAPAHARDLFEKESQKLKTRGLACPVDPEAAGIQALALPQVRAFDQVFVVADEDERVFW
jgi:hypothetical protein